MKQLTYGSICSGIEAATVAWHPLGWRPAWFAEIDPFPNAVLAHHYPEVPNLGDFTKIDPAFILSHAPIDLLVGGTPCQSFSVAGRRLGLDDPRGNLTLEWLRLVSHLLPRWLVWENVPGVLSDDGGRTFGTILGTLAKLGYGFAYRVLDAQFFGVPQRRRRVFVVGYFGNWRRAAAVLFEPESLSGYPTPSREAGEDVAPTLSARTKGGGGLGTDFDLDGGLIAGTLQSGGTPRGHGTAGINNQAVASNHIVAVPILEAGARTGASTTDPRAGLGIGEPGNPMFTLQAGKQHAVAFNLRGRDGGAMPEAASLASLRAANGGSSRSYMAREEWGARRLTPRECERLQGFPDDYTLVPYHDKPVADGPRYKALGNSMAVPIMEWIGQRIQKIESMSQPVNRTH